MRSFAAISRSLVASLLLVACSADEEVAEPVKPAEPAEPAEPAKMAEPVKAAEPAKAVEPVETSEPAPDGAKSSLQLAMDKHFIRAVQLERAVIDGDLDQAKAHARWIVAEQPKQDMAEAWLPLLEGMQRAAAEVAGAKDLPSAARSTGALVASCGACHRALGKGPQLAEPPALVEGESTAARMERHSWAASRMREGIIGPSASHWIAGAGAVSVAPPEPCPIPNKEILAPDVLKLRERIYEIGAEAAATTDDAARAKVYGEFLTTCAGCHVGGC